MEKGLVHFPAPQRLLVSALSGPSTEAGEVSESHSLGTSVRPWPLYQPRHPSCPFLHPGGPLLKTGDEVSASGLNALLLHSSPGLGGEGLPAW